MTIARSNIHSLNSLTCSVESISNPNSHALDWFGELAYGLTARNFDPIYEYTLNDFLLIFSYSDHWQNSIILLDLEAHTSKPKYF